MSSTLLTHCDVGVAACAPPGASRHPRLVLATTILASSLAFIDGSVVNVGLPAIARGLNADAADLQWAINAYLLPLSALLLLGGAVGDRFGRRRILIGGIAIFALATTLCAAAPSLTFLLVGRALQGVGAALLLPTSLAILGGAFSGKGRGGAIGTWAAAGAAAGAIGPVIGGWLIDTVGWRAIFLLNLPVAVAAIGLAWGFVQNDTSDEAAPLDVVGGALATLGLGGLTWGLTIGAGPGGWTPWALVLLAGGAVLIAAFGAVEHGLGDRAMAPLAMFGSPTFYSATRAGAALLPFPLVMAIASPASGALAGRIGSRAPPVVGSVLVAAGLFLMLRVGAHTDYWTTVLPPILIIALGMAGAAAPLTTAVLNSVDARHTGSASGFNSAAARTGGLIATALLGTVLAAQGPGLTAEFHAAAVVGALSCLAAAACGLALIGKSA
jgi:MFS family permease